MLQSTRDRMEEQADDYCAEKLALREYEECAPAWEQWLGTEGLSAYIEHRLTDPAFRQTMMEVE